MSSTIIQCTEKLLQAVLSSEEYQNYLKIEEALSTKPELKRQIDEFRSKNFELQNREGIDVFEAVNKLNEEYADLKKHALVNAYFEAEVSICKMLQHIHGQLMERVGLSIPEGLM